MDDGMREPAERRAERAQMRRKQVLDAATHWFRQLGVHSTSMAEIAKQTTTIPPEILEMVFLPIFGTKAVDAEGVQGMTNLAVKYGLISEADAPAPETVLAGGN